MTEAWVVLKRANRSVRIDSSSVVIGRSAQCQVIAGDNGVSRRHCEIVVGPNRLIVRDLGSRHGTLVDGHRVTGESPLRPGAVIELGPRGPRYKVESAGFDGVEFDGSARGAKAGARATVTARPSSEQVRRMTAAARADAAGGATGDAGEQVEVVSRFIPALFIGWLAGIGLMLALMAFVDLGAWIEAAREAVGR